MIAFDNGPAHGDYVRYIDDLLARSAIAAASGVLSPTDPGPRGPMPLDASTPRSPATANAWSRQADRGTGFAATSTPSAKATAAAAIASALASGQTTGRSVPMHAKIGLSAILVGIVIIIIGFVSPLNIVAIVGGGVLIAWAVRMMRDAAART